MFITICINITLFFTILSWLTCKIQCNNLITHKYLSLPLSFGICLLYILRKISFDNNNNRPNKLYIKLLYTLSYLLLFNEKLIIIYV